MSKAKPKMVSGVLARDANVRSRMGFCEGAAKKHIRLASGVWCGSGPSSPTHCWTTWTAKEFADHYDLRDENGKPCPPPRKGQAFEAELEL